MRILRFGALLTFAMILVSFVSARASADSWALPTTTIYPSAAGTVRVTVTPRDLENQLDFFEDKLGKVEPAGQKQGGSPAASARLERRSGKTWQTMWEKSLLNEVAPVSVIASDDGEYVVTLDEWHGTGYGPNVVVVYGAGGGVVRALALSDLVPGDYIKALPHSVSSIQWRGQPRFSADGQHVVIPVAIPSREFEVDPARVEIAVKLADGSVSVSDPVAWEAARVTGRTVLAAKIADEAAARAAFIAPLLGPSENSERAWSDYLYQAVDRTNGEAFFPEVIVLRAPGAKDYAASEKEVRKALARKLGTAAIASLSEPNLVAVLTKTASGLRERSLADQTLFLALSDQYWQAAVAAMKHTGARLIQLDPTEPIPQRADRIAQLDGPTP